MKRLVALAALATLAASPNADAQMWRTITSPSQSVPYSSPTVVMYPQSRMPYWGYRGGAPGYAAYRGGMYAGNPFPPAYAYGGYGFGGPAGLADGMSVYRPRDWDFYREEMEQEREDYEDWVEDQQELVEDRTEEADEEREDRVRNYREYRDRYREQQREAWEEWREKRFKD